MNRVANTPDDYLTLPYGRLLVRDPEGGFSAEMLEFPGCVAEGDTADEAIANVERAAKAWIASEIEAQHNIPEPVSGADYSGRIALRLPRSLHRALAIKAHRDHTSINQEIVSAVATWLGADDMYQRISERFARRQSAIFIMPMVTWGAFGAAAFSGLGFESLGGASISATAGSVSNAYAVSERK